MQRRALATRGFVLGGVTAAVLGLHCGADRSATFTAEGDDRFVGAIAGTYTATTKAGDVVTMVLCEAASSRSLACIGPAIGQVSDCPPTCHVIAGGGRGKDETLPIDKNGCGCYGAHADLPVALTLAFGAGQAEMAGTVNVSPSDGDAYGEPRRLFAAADQGRLARADVSGFFRHDGRLEVDVRAAGAPLPPVADASSDGSLPEEAGAPRPPGDGGAAQDAGDAQDGKDAENGTDAAIPARGALAEHLVFVKVDASGCRSP